MNLMPHYDLPSALQIEITSYCNLKCKMCPLETGKTLSSRQPGHMKNAIWKEILPMARVIGKVIIAGYGEPLINRNCMALLKDLNGLEIRMSIATNGAALTRQIAAKLARLPHLIHINVSIDSPDSIIYREIRGGDIKKTLKGLENLMAVIDDPHRVTVSSVLMHKNIDSLVAFPTILAKLGVKKYCLQGLIDYNPELHGENLLYHKGIAPYLDQIRAVCDQYGIELLFSLSHRLDLELKEPLKARSDYFTPRTLPGKETKVCFVPWEIPFIDKDGRVFPCCNASTDPAWIMGDLRENNLADIWQGTIYRKFRQDLLDGQTIPAICRNCTVVPLGEHPLRLYSAKILFEKSGFRNQNEMCVVVQNTGSCSWTPETPIFIGTTNPKDRASVYFHPGWLNSNRIASFTEKLVPPGETATFKFRITPVPDAPTELFQLLFEGRCWLPDTCFEIRSEASQETHSAFSKQPLLSFLRKDKIYSRRHGFGKRLTSPGERWLRVYSAKILFEKSVLNSQSNMRVVVQNTGACYWTQDTHLLIGTANPKDRISAYFHPDWISSTRIVTFTENIVPPGGIATFNFQITPVSDGPTEVFQLVIEGKCWLPNTRFEIPSGE